MLEPGFARALVIAALSLTATLSAGAAQAQQPAPPVVAPAAPPMTGGYAPPAYPTYPTYPSSPAPSAALGVEYPKEMRWRSTGMVAGGVALLSFSLIGLIAGSTLVAAHEPTKAPQNPGCFDCGFDPSLNAPVVVLKPGFQTAGIATLVGSAVAMGAGITLLVIGAKKVPAFDGVKAARVTPSLRVGPAGATLIVQF